MPIDASIPLQAKNIQLESPVNQLVMLNEATKFGEMNRSIDTQNKLRDLYSQGIDVSTPEGFKKVAALDPATALKLRTDALQGQKLQGDIKKTGLEVDEKKLGIMRERSKDLLQNTSNENFIAHTQENVRDGLITFEQGQRAIQNYTIIPANQRVAFINQNLARAEKVYEMNTISAAQQQTNATTQRGQDLTNSATIRGQNMQYDPTLQGNLAAAKAGGTEYGKAGAQANIALPGAIATGEEAIRKVDALVGALPVKNAEGKIITPATKPHKGFESAVGAPAASSLFLPGLRYIPGTNASDFMARLNEVQGGAFLQAFNTLKGGGSITETEGTKATAAINRMSTSQSEKEFNTAAREYQDILRTGIERAKAKAANLGGGVPVGRGGEIDFNSLK